MNEGIETIAGEERVSGVAEIPDEGVATEPQTPSQSPEKVELADPEFLKEVVVGLIEGKEGKTYVKEIIYALTLKRKIPKDLFNVIRSELRTIEETGEIVHLGKGKYQSPNDPLPPGKRRPQSGKSPAPQVAARPKRRRRPSREDQFELEEKMRGAFDESYHVVPPKKTRRRGRKNS